MKLQVAKGTTSKILTVFIQDSSSTTGAGLSGLDQTSSIVGGYVREGGTGVALAVDENVTTEGTYEAPTTAAQIRIGTPANMRTGTYELHLHNDLLATGADSVFITLGGAANMADLIIEIQLTSVNLNDASSGGMADLSELQSVLSAGILARTNNQNLNALLGVADTAGEDVPGQTAFEVADEVITGAFHNVTNSLGRIVRELQDLGTYALGAVWIDTVNGVAGTADREGTFLQPSNNIADANTIAAALNVDRFVMGSGSTITFAAAQTNQEFFGKNWTLALGGQSIAGTHFNGAEVSGISTGVASFDHCHLNICTFAGGEFTDCGLQDTITLSAVGSYTFINCYHAEAGAPSTIDFASLGGAEVHVHNWHGNLTVLNMVAGDTLHFSSSNGHLTLDASCTGGIVNLTGTFGFTNNASGQTRNDLGQIYDRIGAPVGADISDDIANVVDLLLDEINTGATHNVNNSVGKQIRQAAGSITGLAQAATASSITLPTTAPSVNDVLNGSVVVIPEGTGAGQHRLITSYIGATRVAQITPNWDVTPDATSEVTVRVGRVNVDAVLLAAINALVAGRLDSDIGAKTGNVALSVQEKLDVNAEVDDVLAVDTRTLPGQVAPPLTPTYVESQMHLYKAWRNDSEQDGSEQRLFADNGTTVDQKRSVNKTTGGTVELGKVAVGP